MLLVIIFLLSVFMLAQFFLAREVTGKDAALDKLNKQIDELTSLLALERAGKTDAQANVANMRATLDAAENDKTRLQGLIDSGASGAANAGTALAGARAKADAQKQVSSRALAQVEILNQQIAALRRQLAAIETALAASESRDRESQTRIADLGSRLNVALAQKVQELARYSARLVARVSAAVTGATAARRVRLDRHRGLGRIGGCRAGAGGRSGSSRRRHRGAGAQFREADRAGDEPSHRAHA